MYFLAVASCYSDDESESGTAADHNIEDVQQSLFAGRTLITGKNQTRASLRRARSGETAEGRSAEGDWQRTAVKLVWVIVIKLLLNLFEWLWLSAAVKLVWLIVIKPLLNFFDWSWLSHC